MALSVPLSRFTSRVGGGSAFFVRPHERVEIFLDRMVAERVVDGSVAVFMSRESFDGGRLAPDSRGEQVRSRQMDEQLCLIQLF